jgi:HAD superfamily hydrolase (TIGR01549 family)
MTEYDGLLCDHDGVLVTLTEWSRLREAAHEALLEVGVSDPSPGDADAITVDVSLEELKRVARCHDVTPEDVWKSREDRFQGLMNEATRASDKRPYDDVSALHAVEQPTGIVSNNQRRVVEFILNQYGLTDLFGTVRARDPSVESLDRKKPSPTYLERAMADLDCSNPLYVGDSESDVVAADRADLDAAFIRRSHNADTSLDARPTYTVDGLDEVVDLV